MDVNRIDVTQDGKRLVGYQVVHEDGRYTESFDYVEPLDTVPEWQWSVYLEAVARAAKRVAKERDAP